MERKRTKGRQKIAIERIEKESDCFATFSKRRLGVFKKTSELCTLCNVDVGIIVYSPTGKPYSFFHPTMESVVDRFRNPNRRFDDSSRLLEAYTRTRAVQLNLMLDKLGEQLEAEKEREKQLDVHKNETGCCQGWWEGPIEKLNKEQVEQMTGWLENLQSQLISREKELKRRASSSFPSTSSP
ncbi:hypothetical protein Pfo_007152 [Paulownia fortunei]|nr:hypothetical protein Pfo_007152 [Paulownia fortunei]